MVSKARDDLPDPLRPVIVTNLFFGISTSIFLRLCERAPLTLIVSIVLCDVSMIFVFEVNCIITQNLIIDYQ